MMAVVQESRGQGAAVCCASFYEQDWVRTLFGDHFHPGGEALTRRLIDDLALSEDERVLDLACGVGTTAMLLVEDFDIDVTGLDYSAKNLARAQGRSGVCDRLAYVQGSADALPFDDETFDAVLCECAVSTFFDKPRVAAELQRVLKPGGRLAISDMAVYGQLPPDLAAFGRGWSCVDDALTFEGYRDLFERVGFETLSTVDESDVLLDMVVDLKRKLLMAAFGELAGFLEKMDVDLAELRGHDRTREGSRGRRHGPIRAAQFSAWADHSRGLLICRSTTVPTIRRCGHWFGPPIGRSHPETPRTISSRSAVAREGSCLRAALDSSVPEPL